MGLSESRLSDAIFKTTETDLLLKHVAHFPEAIDAVGTPDGVIAFRSSCAFIFA